jgi:hypothetical protein
MLAILGTCAVLCQLPLRADLEVGAPRLQAQGAGTKVSFEAKNTFKQPVKAARAWVFLMDSEGKVVGNQAEWVVGGGERPSDTSPPSAVETVAQCVVVVPTARPPVSAQVTFSRLILADGTVVAPQTSVKPAP